MPEAAVHENDGCQSRQNHVRLPRQMARVQAIAISQTVHDGSDSELRLRVFASDARHVPAASRFRQPVSHRSADDFLDDFRNLPRQQRRHGIPDLGVLLGTVALEEVIVGEGLQACGLSH